jgi:putative hemolysin
MCTMKIIFLVLAGYLTFTFVQMISEGATGDLFTLFGSKEEVVVLPPRMIVATSTFACTGGKNVQAIFYKDGVNLVLSDARTVSLPQVVSGSGARYANNDETFVFWNKGDTAFVTEGASTTFKGCVDTKSKITAPSSSVVKLGNPASANCTKVGGTLSIEKRGDGGEYGLCHFQENRACEEWALLRGECPVGGRKTTGFDTIDQNYCAWLGGNTTAVTNSVCTFKNGSQCSTKEFYNGTCVPK